MTDTLALQEDGMTQSAGQWPWLRHTRQTSATLLARRKKYSVEASCYSFLEASSQVNSWGRAKDIVANVKVVRALPL